MKECVKLLHVLIVKHFNSLGGTSGVGSAPDHIVKMINCKRQVRVVGEGKANGRWVQLDYRKYTVCTLIVARFVTSLSPELQYDYGLTTS